MSECSTIGGISVPVCDKQCNMNMRIGRFRCHGQLDGVLTPSGDQAILCGRWNLLQQHVVLWASTPLGEDIDPKCGCILHKYQFGKAITTNYRILEMELKANLEYNFPEYRISNVRVVSAFDQSTDIHGIVCSVRFDDQEMEFFTDSEGLAELWRDTRQTLGALAYITNAKA
jgi:hypothetical protein